MHGDFSLNPRTSRDRVSRVLQQMGRVQLDSDFNEQTEATLRALRGLGSDVIGAHGGVGNSFQLIPGPPTKPLEFVVRWGHYYVDGIRCVNLPPDTEWWELVSQPNDPHGEGLPVMNHAESFWKSEREQRGNELIYLAVWERHTSSAEDDSIREVALGGPDTTTRASVVWQIRSIDTEDFENLRGGLGETAPFDEIYVALNLLLRPRGRLRAKAAENEKTDPCVISPEARYRGENRLYRVEIHDAGDPETNKPATFKWSSDNGSIVYPVRSLGKSKTEVRLESLGRDERTAIVKNDWVEVVDDDVTLQRTVNPLLQVLKVDRQRMTVELSGEPLAGSDPKKHPILRRWAEKPRNIDPEVSDPTDLKTGWKELSDGVEVQFSLEPPRSFETRRWRTGDYWLIPARSAVGDVLWPGDRDNPLAVRPHGIDEHYAPLALFRADAARTGGGFTDLRATFDPIAKRTET